MDRAKSLENIANGFKAANEIYSMRNNMERSDVGSFNGRMPAGTIIDMLAVIADYSPERYRGSLHTTVDKSNLYSRTYTNMKHHVENMKSHKATEKDLLRTMEILKPTLKGRTHTTVDKILRIFEIINS